jgi:hypothetical protein
MPESRSKVCLFFRARLCCFLRMSSIRCALATHGGVDPKAVRRSGPPASQIKAQPRYLNVSIQPSRLSTTTTEKSLLTIGR